MVTGLAHSNGRGLQAPARFLVAALLAMGSCAAAAQAPSAGRPQAAPQAAIPDAVTTAKLIWTTMAAVDHANQTGNYSVLRDLGAPSFQENNNAAALAAIFQTIRAQRLDLSNTLIVSPTYDIPPTIIEGGVLRARGVFPLRPTAIAFDLLFQPVGTRWALLGISIAPAAPLPTRR